VKLEATKCPGTPIDISTQEAIEFLKAFPKASRFLVDENLGPELAPTLPIVLMYPHQLLTTFVL